MNLSSSIATIVHIYHSQYSFTGLDKDLEYFKLIKTYHDLWKMNG